MQTTDILKLRQLIANWRICHSTWPMYKFQHTNEACTTTKHMFRVYYRKRGKRKSVNINLKQAQKVPVLPQINSREVSHHKDSRRETCRISTKRELKRMLENKVSGTKNWKTSSRTKTISCIFQKENTAETNGVKKICPTCTSSRVYVPWAGSNSKLVTLKHV